MSTTPKPRPSGANEHASAKDQIRITLNGPDGSIKQETTA